MNQKMKERREFCPAPFCFSHSLRLRLHCSLYCGGGFYCEMVRIEEGTETGKAETLAISRLPFSTTRSVLHTPFSCASAFSFVHCIVVLQLSITTAFILRLPAIPLAA
jgi:hypothetical protein